VTITLPSLLKKRLEIWDGILQRKIVGTDYFVCSAHHTRQEGISPHQGTLIEVGRKWELSIFTDRKPPKMKNSKMNPGDDKREAWWENPWDGRHDLGQRFKSWMWPHTLCFSPEKSKVLPGVLHLPFSSECSPHWYKLGSNRAGMRKRFKNRVKEQSLSLDSASEMSMVWENEAHNV
jgi:hypothetical protein